MSAGLVRGALVGMGCGGAAGPYGVVAGMLGAAGEEGVELVRLLAD